MGYYTDFNLTHDNPELDNESVAQVLYEISGYRFPSDLQLNEARWYEWAKDMKRLSSRYPDTLFTLHGSGEEKGDLWVAYFRADKMQIAEAVITLAPFDPSLLK